MTYEKPEVEVVKFETEGFMTTSMSFTSTAAALTFLCTNGYTETTNYNKISCGVFGGYNSANISSSDKPKPQVTLNGGTYVFDYHGKHWACSIVQ